MNEMYKDFRDDFVFAEMKINVSIYFNYFDIY
jgi:hypothetical protein